MKSSAALLLTSAALTTAAADSASTWVAWSSSTPAPAPAPAPVTWTDWVTSVETLYSTVENYITVTQTLPPVTVTLPPVTVTLPPVTVTLPPVTVTDVVTETDVSVSVSGSVATIINTETDISVSVSGSVATVVDTVTVTQPPVTVYVTSLAVSVSVSESIATVVDTITDTVTITSVSRSVSTTTESALSGLVTCPPRIVNPTYTPPAPLPSTYLWGCPPGLLCHPKREGCNFEQDLPAGTYFCAPEECLPVADVPSIDLYLDYEDINDTCASLTPIDDYFNINPIKFGLGFGIFDIYGQSTCSPIDTVYVTVPTTVVQATTVVEATTVDVPVPTTIVDYSNIPTTIVEYSNVPVPTTIVQVITQTITIAPVYSSSSTWGAWKSAVTKRADAEEHALEKRIVAAASQCYVLCDYAGVAWQRAGNDPVTLCAPDGQWTTAFSRVTSCTKAHDLTGIFTVETQLNTPISICNAYRASKRSEKRSAAEQLKDLQQGVAPALRFARS